MHLSFATFIPSCIACRAGDADRAASKPGQIENTVRSVTKAARLSRDGQQALLQWSTWAAYATALTVYDPHLSQQPGWKIVLPIDHARSRENLHQLLLRAGESVRTAQDAVDAFYKNTPIPTLQDAIEAFHDNAPSSVTIHASLLGMAWREWLSHLPDNDLPEQIVPFEMLPAPFREVALFHTNLAGRDCSDTPGLTRLDLRHLYAPDADFQGCDLSESNFFQADLSRANFINTRIRGTILPANARLRATAAPGTPPRPSMTSSLYPKGAHDDRASTDSMYEWRGPALLI